MRKGEGLVLPVVWVCGWGVMTHKLAACLLPPACRRVLEGEIAQRAEVNRQLKEVEKRLMLADNLVPASPLVTQAGTGGGGRSPVGLGCLAFDTLRWLVSCLRGWLVGWLIGCLAFDTLRLVHDPTLLAN